MKWYWILIIAIVLLVLGFFVTKTILNKKNISKTTDTINNPIPKLDCNPNQSLAAPPIGKEWVCQNGNWTLVAINSGIA